MHGFQQQIWNMQNITKFTTWYTIISEAIFTSYLRPPISAKVGMFITYCMRI